MFRLGQALVVRRVRLGGNLRRDGQSGNRLRCDLYNFKYSLNRRVCVRLTGISVALSSFIRRM
jgi:hypothetical protein